MANVTPLAGKMKKPPTPVKNAVGVGLGSPVVLSAQTQVWRVSGPSVDVFLETPTFRRLLVIVPDGGYVFGLPDEIDGVLSITAQAGTELIPYDISEIENGSECLIESTVLIESANSWIQGISAHFEEQENTNEHVLVVAAGQTVTVTSETVLTSQRTPCWLQLPFGQSVMYEGSDHVFAGPVHFPVVSGIKAMPQTEGDIEGVDTAFLAAHGQLCMGLRNFNTVLPDLFLALSKYHDAETLSRLAEGADRTSTQHDTNVNRLSTLGSQSRQRTGMRGHTSEVIVRVAQSIGVEVDSDVLGKGQKLFVDIPGMLRQAGLRSRQILLREKWWRSDLGGLIAIRAGTTELVGLMRKGAHYIIYDPQTGLEEKLTKDVAEQLCGPAFSITPQLAADVKDLKSLTGFILGRMKADAVVTVFAGACMAALGLFTPLATGVIIDRIIPGNARNLIVEIGAALVLIAIINAFLGVVRSIAEERIEIQTSTDMQLSVMNRILNIKPVFFRTSSAGDLSQRMEGLGALRGAVVSFTLQASMAAVFFVFYLALLFSFDTRLALSAIALVLIIGSVTLCVHHMQVRYRLAVLETDGKLRSLVFEILDAVPKLRVAGAEERMISRWAQLYFDEQNAVLRMSRIGNRFGSFSAAYQTLSLLLLFGVAVYLSKSNLSAGTFVAFLLAFGVFQSVVLGFLGSVLRLMASLPQLERALPFLTAELENHNQSVAPGTLSGRIEMSGIRFAYEEKGPAILNKFNFNISPGEHIAVVGASGSGKSSILRLLLGFEAPTSGSITYDGKELRHLDLARLRQQIGVVMQSSSLFAGSIYENIQGAGNASLAQCEDAARKAGLLADLETFPMGMHTPLTEGAGTISGGQKQRILIARALAGSPNILFMDEATSALDNNTQTIVTKALDALNVTRLTVAHRLSTVRQADRICVLSDGCFVEEGTYDELMAMDGAFAELAKRQLT